jgi:hypothetical protein
MKWSRELLIHAFYQFFLAVDQLANTVLGLLHALVGLGSFETWADETLSSRCGRLGHRYPYKAYKAIIDVLFLWQGKDHCVKAYVKEKEHRQLPPEAR